MSKYKMLDRTKCLPDENNYVGKLLIFKPESLKEEFRQPHFQYFYATGGFGCYPDKLGSKVFGEFLADGEECYFYRSDFLGAADTEQLPQWAKTRFEQLTALKMNVRIFQINDSKDKNNLEFMSYDTAMKKGGVDPSIYRQVYGGTVNCADIEGVFDLCNTSTPPGYYGHSLSVSDIVEVCDGENKGFYYCDTIGFKPIDFDVSKVDRSDMLKVLIFEVGKEPYIAEIRDGLKAKQSVVGGLIEPVYFTDNDNVLIYCDEEFLFKGYKPNRQVGDIIEVSLTDEQIERYSAIFHYPLIYLTNEEAAELSCENCEESLDTGISQS